MLTGLVYLKPEKKSFISLLNVADDPLCTLPLERTGAFGYTVRVLPKHPMMAAANEFGLVTLA